jgi:hypothetical protein
MQEAIRAIVGTGLAGAAHRCRGPCDPRERATSREVLDAIDAIRRDGVLAVHPPGTPNPNRSRIHDHPPRIHPFTAVSVAAAAAASRAQVTNVTDPGDAASMAQGTLPLLRHGVQVTVAVDQSHHRHLETRRRR